MKHFFKIAIENRVGFWSGLASIVIDAGTYPNYFIHRGTSSLALRDSLLRGIKSKSKLIKQILGESKYSFVEIEVPPSIKEIRLVNKSLDESFGTIDSVFLKKAKQVTISARVKEGPEVGYLEKCELNFHFNFRFAKEHKFSGIHSFSIKIVALMDSESDQQPQFIFTVKLDKAVVDRCLTDLLVYRALLHKFGISSL